MSTIRKVVVLGASGNVGRPIVGALIASGFDVTAVSRSTINSSTSNLSAKYLTTDYSYSSLSDVFKNQDAIVCAYNPAAAAAHHKAIAVAALACGIKHLITPDFSSDTFNAHVDELQIFEPKRKAQRYLERKIQDAGSSMHWTAIICGPFWDWAIPRGIFWLDPKSRTVTIFGSGNQRISMSGISMVGRASVEVLSRPEKYVNRPAYFADYTISNNQLLAIAEEVAKEKWNTRSVSLGGLREEGLKQWDEDTKNGVHDRLNSTAYQMLGTYGLFEGDNRYTADFGDKAEAGWQKGVYELEEELRVLLEQKEHR
ncbi:uncharacterized protein PAC_19817 [Phialocephala subalpina]|uniref:NmrA-like domain-containing protein n=1 Tax=Phialocephala subalpina TaxID=576137 RepID=A0A1L7XY20_9HELO|nr:uncharacterized protein PAC_19817 [Phialocephala subalpina]